MALLDKKDRRIVYELDRNARQPLAAIAKKAGLSREAVLYRLKRLLKNGVIRDYLTVIDMSRLGFSHYKVCVKLHNISEKEEAALVAWLCKNPFVTWVASCDGKYSLLFALKARDLEETSSLLQEVNNRNWKFFLSQDVAPIVRGRHFYRDYLVGGRGQTERRIFWGTGRETVEIDEADAAILDALAKNARASSVEMARKAGLSPDAVIARVRRLQKSGLVAHCMIWPDVNRLKGAYYKVLVSLRDMNSEKQRQLEEFCMNHPNIVYIVNTFGPWQFEMDVEVEGVAEFRALMRGFLEKFSGIVSDYTPLNIYQEYKFRFFERECLQKVWK